MRARRRYRFLDHGTLYSVVTLERTNVNIGEPIPIPNNSKHARNGKPWRLSLRQLVVDALKLNVLLLGTAILVVTLSDMFPPTHRDVT